MRHVLIADDEARIREVVQYALEKEGFRVTSVADGRAAIDVVDRESVDLLVLDVMMPGVDGYEVCRRLRATRKTPILFLSAKGEEIDKVLGLEMGGDDYLAKPFSPRELVARVRAILRRIDDTQQTPARVLSHGPVRIDPERHLVRCDEAIVDLTPTEFGVLQALYERPGGVLSRAQLMERAYAWDNHVTERTIDTHVRRIRAKFRECGVDPIATVHGVGYKAPDY
ncbi:MAG: two-component system response regulator CreB [Sandaracinus sp.]|nr:two-component system response regulator CreB [Sandaracinus sp.]